MTRRRVYFYDQKQNKLYSTPEFNGDKEEFVEFRKAEDSCDKNFNEILREFEGVKTFEEFKKASNKAQSYYHSFLGDTVLPIEEKENIEYNDEIYMIDKEGKTYLYNPRELTRKYLLDICDRGDFIYRDIKMKVTKNYLNTIKGNLYTLIIYPIKNVARQNECNLGKFEKDEFNVNFDYEFKEGINKYIDKMEMIKQNSLSTPIKLELVVSPNSNYNIAFRSEKNIIYVLDAMRDGFELIKLNKKSLEPEYDLKTPVEINGKQLFPKYERWRDTMIFDLEDLDINGLEMATRINDYMTIREDIFDKGSQNKNLKEIYEDIYNEENINKYFFERYKDDEYINELKEKYYYFLDENQNDLHIQNEDEEEEM